MDSTLLIGALILVGLSVAWVWHRRSVHRVTPVLERLAAARNGKVESRGPFLAPKLTFSHSGVPVEVSSAIDGESQAYTCALFAGLDWKGFEFRILPRSVQTTVDNWVGLKKPMSTGGRLDKRLTVYTNDNRRMEAMLSDRVRTDLLSWAEQEQENRINDVRNYDDKLIYAVTGTLDKYEEYQQLIDTACRFHDAAANAVHPGV